MWRAQRSFAFAADFAGISKTHPLMIIKVGFAVYKKLVGRCVVLLFFAVSL
jgi:hypothetical protein